MEPDEDGFEEEVSCIAREAYLTARKQLQEGGIVGLDSAADTTT